MNELNTNNLLTECNTLHSLVTSNIPDVYNINFVKGTDTIISLMEKIVLYNATKLSINDILYGRIPVIVFDCSNSYICDENSNNVSINANSFLNCVSNLGEIIFANITDTSASLILYDRSDIVNPIYFNSTFASIINDRKSITIKSVIFDYDGYDSLTKSITFTKRAN